MPNDQLSNPLMPGGSQQASMQPSMPMAEYVATPPQGYYAPAQMSPDQAAMQRMAQYYAAQVPMVQPGVSPYQNAANQMQQAMQGYMPQPTYGPVAPNPAQVYMQQAARAMQQYAPQVQPLPSYVPPTMYMNAPMQPTMDVPPAPLFQPMPAQAQPNTGGGYIVEALNMPSQNAGGENLA